MWSSGDLNKFQEFWPEDNQNYVVFCAWAGVRRETAEQRIGHRITSIAEERGWPNEYEKNPHDQESLCCFATFKSSLI